ncbi:hypothetical protein M422DRAFT_53760 [Sphaerobolus stellatus SS14]|uniref:CxC5 like cysteine cluster associated with KDZ domain-containing protein n=1 Tax=Sphaerobolus stellatus (strain SS14) TaxID=990650 RepID=A0A0C9UZB4_SPHS4|nr:hypothetical protein M422DRAFT_53760 [Sphaerobolus stellatus SS14]
MCVRASFNICFPMRVINSIFRSPIRPHSSAKYSWERLPLATLAVAVLAIIEAAPLFSLDFHQRKATRRQSTIWITHFTQYLGKKLRKLPGPFGQEYSSGVSESSVESNNSSLLISHEIIYSLAEYLGLIQEAVEPWEVGIPLPLLPVLILCPHCKGYLRKESEHASVWVFHPTSAHQTPAFVGECRKCDLTVYPDRYVRNGDEVYVPNPRFIQIGRGKYSPISFAINLTSHVYHAHVPLSTFATHWTQAHAPQDAVTGKPEITLQPYNLWRLFIIHNISRISETPLVIPAITPELLAEFEEDQEAPENRDDMLVNSALKIFPRVQHGSYYTYLVPNTSTH